jgi:hypothetical protein
MFACGFDGTGHCSMLWPGREGRRWEALRKDKVMCLCVCVWGGGVGEGGVGGGGSGVVVGDCLFTH